MQIRGFAAVLLLLALLGSFLVPGAQASSFPVHAESIPTFIGGWGGTTTTKSYVNVTTSGGTGVNAAIFVQVASWRTPGTVVSGIADSNGDSFTLVYAYGEANYNGGASTASFELWRSTAVGTASAGYVNVTFLQVPGGAAVAVASYTGVGMIGTFSFVKETTQNTVSLPDLYTQTEFANELILGGIANTGSGFSNNLATVRADAGSGAGIRTGFADLAAVSTGTHRWDLNPSSSEIWWLFILVLDISAHGPSTAIYNKIGFYRSLTPFAGTSAAVTFQLSKGDTVVLMVNGNTPVASVSDTAGNLWGRQSSQTVAGTIAEQWAVLASVPSTFVTVTITWQGSPGFFAYDFAIYANVVLIGQTVHAIGNSQSPSLSLVTQNANNVVVGGFVLSGSNAFVAIQGTLRVNTTNPAGLFIPTYDNTSVLPASVTVGLHIFTGAENWAESLVELKTSILSPPAPYNPPSSTPSNNPAFYDWLPPLVFLCVLAVMTIPVIIAGLEVFGLKKE